MCKRQNIQHKIIRREIFDTITRAITPSLARGLEVCLRYEYVCCSIYVVKLGSVSRSMIRSVCCSSKRNYSLQTINDYQLYDQLIPWLKIRRYINATVYYCKSFTEINISRNLLILSTDNKGNYKLLFYCDKFRNNNYFLNDTYFEYTSHRN